MGDPRKQKNKYRGPRHPWERERLIDEKVLLAEFGLKNKKDIWRQVSRINKIKDQVKKVNSQIGKGIDLERDNLIRVLHKYGLLKEGQILDDALELTPRDIMERRLQTMAVRSGIARTMKQSRQFIVHGHVTVNGKRITSPSYLVNKEEQFKIGFIPKSPFCDLEHPERITEASSKEEKIIKKEIPNKKAILPEDDLDVSLDDIGVIEDEVSKEISSKLENDDDVVEEELKE